MNAPRRLTALPLPACLLRTTRRLTSSRFSPSGKSLPSPLVLTTSRRLAPLTLLLIALLALGGVLLWSAPAQAQTATVLVKNTEQTAQSSTFQLSTAATKRTQAFTTGSHSAGYTLNSIGLSFGDIAEITTAGAQLTVTLNEVSGGDPGSVLCTLTDPATFTGAGVQTFDAPAADPCPTLKARTTYFAVIERVVFPSPDTSISLQITTSGDEDSGGAMGWTIGDARQFFGSGTWTQTASQSHLIEVRGTEAPYQPKRVTRLRPAQRQLRSPRHVGQRGHLLVG